MKRKGIESKRAEKKGRKRAIKNIRNGQSQKKAQNLAYAQPGLEGLLNFVPSPRKISPFSKKKAFLAKLRLI